MPYQLPKHLSEHPFPVDPSRYHSIIRHIKHTLNFGDIRLIRFDLGFTKLLTKELGFVPDYDLTSKLINQLHSVVRYNKDLYTGLCFITFKLEKGKKRGWHCHCLIAIRHRTYFNIKTYTDFIIDRWEHILANLVNKPNKKLNYDPSLEPKYAWFHLSNWKIQTDSIPLIKSYLHLTRKERHEPTKALWDSIDLAILYLSKPGESPQTKGRRYVRTIKGPYYECDDTPSRRVQIAQSKSRLNASGLNSWFKLWYLANKAQIFKLEEPHLLIQTLDQTGHDTILTFVQNHRPSGIHYFCSFKLSGHYLTLTLWDKPYLNAVEFPDDVDNFLTLLSSFSLPKQAEPLHQLSLSNLTFTYG